VAEAARPLVSSSPRDALPDQRFHFSSLWDERLVAVAAVNATAAERAAALPANRAAWIAGELSDGERRDLHRLALGDGGYSAADIDPRTLADEVTAALANGRVLLIGEGRQAARTDAAAVPGLRETPEDRLARQAMAGRGAIPFENRRYRVVPFARFRSAGLSDFRVVPPDEARGVIQRLAERSARTAQERASWAEIADNLSSTSRPGGLVLMYERQGGGRELERPDAPAETPSQVLQQIAPTDWIEVKVLYDDGTPYDGTCSIVLPDGRKIDGTPDADGTLRFDGIDPGSCQVSFPDLDGSAVAAA